MSTQHPSAQSPLWIFGYGSLMWRPDFAFVERREARALGWARRLWQGSTDHRGLPHAPGRVATLVRQPSAVTWGVAYRVSAADVPQVLATLDHRERDGYVREELDIELRSEPPIRALTYLATDANDSYLGPATPTEIANQVRRAQGPSGRNADYVRELLRTLLSMGVTDDHVEEIASLLGD